MGLLFGLAPGCENAPVQRASVHDLLLHRREAVDALGLQQREHQVVRVRTLVEQAGHVGAHGRVAQGVLATVGQRRLDLGGVKEAGEMCGLVTQHHGVHGGIAVDALGDAAPLGGGYRRQAGDAGGQKTLIDNAHEKYQDILRNHEVPPLPDEVVKEMQSIAEAAEKELAT